MTRSIRIFLGLGIALASLAGCQAAVKDQEAYRDRQRRDCAIAGGYFEDNKPGSPDNYTCKGLRNDQADAGPVSSDPPTDCRTKTKTVKRDDGTEITKTDQVCSSF